MTARASARQPYESIHAPRSPYCQKYLRLGVNKPNARYPIPKCEMRL